MDKISDDVPIVLISEFAEALHGRKLLLDEPPDRGSLMFSYAHAHSRLARQMSVCVEAIKQMEHTRREEQWGSSKTGLPQRAADHIQDLAYRATELFDYYLSDLPQMLGLTSSNLARKYRKKIAAIRDPWATLCNRCKHNHRFLVPVEAAFETGAHVCGFAVYGGKQQAMQVDQTIHRSVDVFSYNWTLRRIISSIVQADLLAADLTRSLDDHINGTFVSALAFSLPYVHFIKTLVEHGAGAMPGEIFSPWVKISDEGVNIENSEIPMVEIRDCILRLWVQVLGDSAYLEAPYTREPLNIKIEPFDQALMGYFIRIDINGLLVPQRPLLFS